MQNYILAPLLLLASLLAGPALAQRPNVIVIVADDLGRQDLGCYGNTYFETPNLDRFAQQGKRFTNAYAAAPVCSPSRTSMLTGRYPARVGVTNFIWGRRTDAASPVLPAAYKNYLPQEEITLAEKFKQNQYATALVGKWHLGENTEPVLSHPAKQGFDYVVDHDFGLVPRGKSYEWYVMGDTAATFTLPQLNQRITSHALDYLNKQQKASPFFMMLTYYSPHLPLQATEEKIAKYRKKPNPKPGLFHPTYGAMVEELDDNIGRVLSQLKQNKQEDNTIVIFLSDNGGLSVEEAGDTQPTTNAPYKDGKGYLSEGGIRIPLLVRWPGKVKAGTVSPAVVSTIDFYPTLLDIIQNKALDKQPIDGVSFKNQLLSDQQSGAISQRKLYWHYPHFSNQGSRPAAAVRYKNFKLIESLEDNSVRLYDLAADPYEKTDLKSQQPQLAAQLQQAIHQWQTTVNANMPPKKTTSHAKQPE
ncbi:sulfatase [Hymenobacter sp.]|uniref:sulfatase n=1 Tax=Hymenobacter sp. TaxID=1898978 RepID=UPI00286A93E1|nr:sulfatase [Hymenobacter sp.]